MLLLVVHMSEPPSLPLTLIELLISNPAPEIVIAPCAAQLMAIFLQLLVPPLPVAFLS